MKRSHVLFGLAVGLVVHAPAFGVFAGEKSLYERLGGEAAITAVVDDFTARAAADPKVNFFRDGKYAKMDVAQFKKHLVAMVASATGGPQKYTGRDMKTAHKGMRITDAEFDALAANLVATLDKFKVPAKEKDELLKIVGSTRPDIVAQGKLQQASTKKMGKKKGKGKKKAP